MPKRRKLRKPRPGVYRDIPYAEYDAWPYVRSSDLKHAMRSPLHYQYALDHVRDRDTASTRFGRMVHAHLTNSVVGEYVIVGEDRWREMKERYARPRATSEWQHLVQKIKAKHRGAAIEIVDPDEWERADACAAAVIGCDSAWRVCDGDSEVSIVWDDADTGIRCKARPDFVGNVLTDIKTTRDASSFERAIWEFRYYRQLSFHQWGWATLHGDLLTPYLVAVESDPPWGVRAAPLSDELLALGREEWQVALHRLSGAVQSGHWSGYSHPQQWEKPQQRDESVTIWIGGEEWSF